MKLTTKVKLSASEFKLGLDSAFLTLGSCFADRVGQKLAENFLNVSVNPVGIHYNPVSLSRAVWYPGASQLFLHQGMWRSLEHHGSLSGHTPQEALARISDAGEACRRAVSSADAILLTLGTSRVFELVASQQVVANCHRLPQSLFRRRRLSLKESVEALFRPLNGWLESDPKRRVILTVSPVRYVRDGLIENNRSKAVLLLCCEELESLHPRIHYFPAFEILTDELRDYRYYADDMVQPSAVAVEYVWQRFCEHYLRVSDREFLKVTGKLRKLLSHRPSPNSDLRALGRKGLELIEQLGRHSLNLDEPKRKFETWVAK